MLTYEPEKLQAGEGCVSVKVADGRATFSNLAFSYPLKLMPPKISGAGSRLANRLTCLYMLTYGESDAVFFENELELMLLIRWRPRGWRYDRSHDQSRQGV